MWVGGCECMGVMVLKTSVTVSKFVVYMHVQVYAVWLSENSVPNY